jgi:integrase
MILVTGQRPGEVTGMRWDEVSDTTWKIPASRIKTRMIDPQPHPVPLSWLAERLLDECKRIASNSPYAFPGVRRQGNEVKPIDRHSLSRALLRSSVALSLSEPCTPQDLRRTVRTNLAALGVYDHIAEHVLNHSLQGMMRVYNQHDYLNEKRNALNRWTDHLADIVGIHCDKD